eukprot:ANDGO_03477.mRNA.1 hypothetical protein
MSLSSNPFALLSEDAPKTLAPVAKPVAPAAAPAPVQPKKPTGGAVRGSTDAHVDEARDNRRRPEAGDGKHHEHFQKPSRPGKREYDRKSGTGRPPGPKKGGAGRGNWGANKDAPAAEAGAVQDANAEATNAAAASSPAVVEASAAPAEPEHVDDGKIPYAEYLKQRQASNAAAAAKQVRKPNEGDDVLKGAKIIYAGDAKSQQAAKNASATASKKSTGNRMNIQEFLADAPAPASTSSYNNNQSRDNANFRGGDRRGAVRGSGARGGKIELANNRDFPTLGSA